MCKGNDGRVANDDIHGSRLIRDWRLFSPPTSVSTKLNAGTSSVGRFYYPGKSMPPTTADLSVSSSSSSLLLLLSISCVKERSEWTTLFVMCSGGAGLRPSPKSPLLVKDIGCLPALKGFLSPCMYSYFFSCFFSPSKMV